jgi:hypothetical protein
MRKQLCLAALLILPMTLTGQSGLRDKSEAACTMRSMSGYLSQELASEPPRPAPLSVVTLIYSESGCLGNCPSFKMTMTLASAEFEGYAYVRRKGKHRSKMPSGMFEHFIQRWHEAKFYAMHDTYCGLDCPNGRKTVILDVQETAIGLTAPGLDKRVFECYFQNNGVDQTPRPPEEYFQFRDELRAFARSKRWLR